MPNLQSGMAPVSQSWSKYTKIIWEKVSHSPVYVSHSYHLGVALVGNATPERGLSDKNVSFLWCFSKISNFRFFIIRSCFYSRVVSLFGPSALPIAQGKWTHPAHPPVRLILPSTPSCMIEITQHALLYDWYYPARPERAEALSPGQRPGYNVSQQCAL